MSKILVTGHESSKIANLIGTILDDHSRITTDVKCKEAFHLFIAVSHNSPITDCNKSIVWEEHWSDNVVKVMSVLRSYNLDGSHQQAGRRGCSPI